MSISKSYCLKHYKYNCKCNDEDYKIILSSKLRPPLSIKNKVLFRQFLDDCPIFVNMVMPYQREAFLNLLRAVKYFNKSINGQSWTNISK